MFPLLSYIGPIFNPIEFKWKLLLLQFRSRSSGFMYQCPTCLKCFDDTALCGDRINGIWGLPWSKPYLPLYNHLQPLPSHKLPFSYTELLGVPPRCPFISHLYACAHVVSSFWNVLHFLFHPAKSYSSSGVTSWDLKASFPGLTWFADRKDDKEKKWRWLQGFGHSN